MYTRRDFGLIRLMSGVILLNALKEKLNKNFENRKLRKQNVTSTTKVIYICVLNFTGLNNSTFKINTFTESVVSKRN